MNVTIYHNPKCETSRNVLAIIREKGMDPTTIEYLKMPLDQHELRHLIDQMKVPVRDVVRWKQTAEVAVSGICETTDDDAMLAAMAAHPILMNRPIVITPKGVKLCRPSDRVNEIL